MKVSIILPTYNEAENIKLIIPELNAELKNYDYEIIVADDNSPDGTWQIVKEMMKNDPRLRLIRRMTDKGLSQAVVEGFSSATGDFLIVMDADRQHDASILPEMISEAEQADIVIGSRKAEGGGIENWSAFRRFISWGATLLAKITLVKSVSDPMSGYFGIKREVFEDSLDRINPRGFKILLEFLARIPDASVSEVGFVFKPREFGESKLSGAVMLNYLTALYDIRFGRILPVRFIKYGMVGLSGVFVNEGSLFVLHNTAGLNVRWSLIGAIEISIIWNYFLNNYFTFRDRSIRGLANIKGLISFNAISSAGALINYAIAILFSQKLGLDLYLSNLLGIIAATGWNYFLNTNITWRLR